MTAEEYAELLKIGAENADLENQTKRQLELAKAIRPKGLQMRNAGKAVVAPSFLELLGAMGQEFRANNLDNAAAAGQRQMVTNTNAQNNRILEAILRARQLQTTEPGGTGLQPPRPRSPYDLGGM